jgi:hypothetical protein
LPANNLDNQVSQKDGKIKKAANLSDLNWWKAD